MALVQRVVTDIKSENQQAAKKQLRAALQQQQCSSTMR